MKIGKTLLIFACLASVPLFARQQIKETPLKVHYAMEKKGDFRATFLPDFKNVKYVDAGVTGKCFYVKVPKDHPKKGFTVHAGSRQYTTFPGTISITGKFKGKGNISLGFIVYNRQYRIYWISRGVGASSGRMNIDSPDAWVEKSFVFKPEMVNVKEITGFLTSVSVKAGSEIYMDDIKTEIIPHPEKASLAKQFPHITEAEARAKWKAKKAAAKKVAPAKKAAAK